MLDFTNLLICFAFALGGAVFVVLLYAYHLYLIYNDQTHLENQKLSEKHQAKYGIQEILVHLLWRRNASAKADFDKRWKQIFNSDSKWAILYP